MTSLGSLVGRAASDALDGRVGVVVGAITSAGRAAAGAGLTHERGPEPDPGTVFEIGSISKIFTALLLAESVRKGELTLDTPLGDAVASLPPPVAAIPLGRLADHTSGLPRLPRGMLSGALLHPSDPYLGWDAARLLASLRRTTPKLTGRVSYSNLGAAVLGLALERVTGTPYAELLTRRVTGPLGLTDTVVGDLPAHSSRRAHGHSKRGQPVGDWTLDAIAPAGGIRSTAFDLLGLVAAHLEPAGSPLEESLRLVVRPRAAYPDGTRVGLGWHRTGPVVWHNGGTGGSFSYVGFDPAASCGVVALTNCLQPVDDVGADLLRRVTEEGG